MISFRYVPAICVLAAIALVPTLIHSYSTPNDSDGRSTAAIPTLLAGYTGVPSERNATWGARRFDSYDWTERVYRRDADELRLTVIRSFDAKSLYHHPELAVAYGMNFHGSEVRMAAGRPDLPVHVLLPGSGSRAVAMYVLAYEDRFIAEPIRFQIRSALEMLFSRRKPLTLFFVVDPDGGREARLEGSGAMALLVAAVDGFMDTPRTTGAFDIAMPGRPTLLVASRAFRVGGDENQVGGRLVREATSGISP